MEDSRLELFDFYKDEIKGNIDVLLSLEEDYREATFILANDSPSFGYALKKILNDRDERLIFINFASRVSFSFMPAYYLVSELRSGLIHYRVKLDKSEAFPVSDIILDAESDLDMLLSVYKYDLYNLQLDEPLYIVINGTDLPFENDLSHTFDSHFLFDKRKLPNNLHVFVISDNKNQADEYRKFMRVIDMRNEEIDYASLFNKYLAYKGLPVIKHLPETYRLHDYIYIINYLSNYVPKEDFDKVLSRLLLRDNTVDLLDYILQLFLSKLSEIGKIIMLQILVEFFYFDGGIHTSTITVPGKYLLGCDYKTLVLYKEIDDEERRIIYSYIRFFTHKENEQLFIFNKRIKEFMAHYLDDYQKIVFNAYEKRVLNAVDYLFRDKEEIDNVGFKTDKKHYLDVLKERGLLGEGYMLKKAILDPLAYQIDYQVFFFSTSILNYDEDEGEQSEFDYSINHITASNVSFVERATLLYSRADNEDLYRKILHDRPLMYVLMYKSRRIVRRIITRYIDMRCEHFLLKDYSANKESIAHELEKSLSYLTLAHKMNPNDEKLNLVDESRLPNSDILSSDLHISMKDENLLINELTLIAAERMFERGIPLRGVFSKAYAKETFSPIIDFDLINNNDEALDDLCEIEEYSLHGFNDFDENIDYLRAFLDKYKKNVSVFAKLTYAYSMMRLYLNLSKMEQRGLSFKDELFAAFDEAMKFNEYCFYSEFYGFMLALYGLIDSSNRKDILGLGLRILKSQGLRKSIKFLIS